MNPEKKSDQIINEAEEYDKKLWNQQISKQSKGGGECLDWKKILFHNPLPPTPPAFTFDHVLVQACI